jgi:hypothetical protein
LGTSLSFQVRRAEPADVAGILDLFGRVFGRAMTPAEWRWKYAENPDGGLQIVAEAQGRIVGHYGQWPMAAWIGGRRRVVAALGDVMTDPAFRTAGGRHNVFCGMGEEMFSRLRRDGIPFGFGFPSPRALAVGRRLLGYREHFPVREISFPVPARASVLPEAGRPRESDRSFDELWKACRPSLASACLERDSIRANWRFRSRPDREYRVVRAGEGASGEWAVLSRVGESALVMDYLLHPARPDRFSRLFESLLAEAAAMGARRLVFWEPPGGPYRALLLDLRDRIPDSSTVGAGFSFVTAVVFDEEALSAFCRDFHFTAAAYDDR